MSCRVSENFLISTNIAYTGSVNTSQNHKRNKVNSHHLLLLHSIKIHGHQIANVCIACALHSYYEELLLQLHARQIQHTTHPRIQSAKHITFEQHVT